MHSRLVSNRVILPSPLRNAQRRRMGSALRCAAALLLLSDALLSLGQPAAHGHAGELRAQGYLGIEFHDLAQSGQGVFHFRPSHQVEIVMVDHDGPAGKAGLHAHDLVETLNGQPVSGANALRQMIHDAGAGSTITLSVERGGRSLVLTAQLESREDVELRAWKSVTAPPPLPTQDESDSEDAHTAQNGPPQATPGRGKRFIGGVLHPSSVGLQLQALSPQLAMYFGAPPSLGLLVESVEGGSAAALAGLEAGDVLLRADSIALHTLSDWTKRLHASKGKNLSLVVLREHHEFTVSLQSNGARSALEWPFRF